MPPALGDTHDNQPDPDVTHDVQKSINLSNGINIDVYALPMIVALSFRLNTFGAYKVRECVMNKLTTNP